jgi:hypothetical protein
MRRPGASPFPPRTRILQRELDRSSGRRYLEIGVGDGGVFLHISARYKVAVDPNGLAISKRIRHPYSLLRGRVVRSTSDQYFESLDPAELFDVSFVDGYHTWDQALRDVENCLRHGPESAVVVMHDCNPPDEPSAMRDPARAARRADWGGSWCGDVWKAIVYLRAARSDLEVTVLDTDFGLGVIRRGATKPIPLDAGDVPNLTYAELDANREQLLGLRPPEG